MMLLAKFLFLLALTTVSTQKQPPTGGRRVIRGDEVKIEEVPFFVELDIPAYKETRSGYLYQKFICGGSIISDRWILTAAHCIDKSRHIESIFAPIAVWIGGSKSEGGKLYALDRLIMHPRYARGEHFHDLALLRLSRRLKYNSLKVSPIALGRTEDIRIGAVASVVGRGKNSELEQQDYLRRRGREKIINGSDCVRGLKKEGEIISDDMIPLFLEATICTINFDPINQSSCYGDSGGPIIVNGTLVGVISRDSSGVPCINVAQPSPPAVLSLHASVPAAAAWIRYHTGVTADSLDVQREDESYSL